MKAFSLYNPKNRTSSCTIDISYIKAEGDQMYVCDRQADFTSIRLMTTSAARVHYAEQRSYGLVKCQPVLTTVVTDGFGISAHR